jgi:hypothetical protein
MRKAIVGSSDAGASSTACRNAAISSGTAGRGASVALSAQIEIPSDVSAPRSDLRSASEQISHASTSPVASKTSVGRIVSEGVRTGPETGTPTDWRRVQINRFYSGRGVSLLPARLPLVSFTHRTTERYLQNRWGEAPLASICDIRPRLGKSRYFLHSIIPSATISGLGTRCF